MISGSSTSPRLVTDFRSCRKQSLEISFRIARVPTNVHNFGRVTIPSLPTRKRSASFQTSPPPAPPDAVSMFPSLLLP